MVAAFMLNSPSHMTVGGLSVSVVKKGNIF